MVVKVPCSVCASPISNNLVRVSEVVAFVHNDQQAVQIIVSQMNEDLTEVSKRPTGNMITSIRCMSLDGQQAIVTTSTEGVTVWDAALINVLYKVTVTPAGKPQLDSEAFCQGVSIGRIADTDHVCVGTSNGSLHLFRLSESNCITQAAVVDGDGEPVLALEWVPGTANSVCVSSGEGQVSLYTAALHSMVFQKSISMSVPVALLASTQQKLLCGSVEGDITILEQGTLIAVMEIAAHSRFLSTMELHPTDSLLLTAAQDGTAIVWDLADLDNNQVYVRSSCLWNNAMITGGTFGPKNQFFLSSYSTPALGMFEYQRGGN